MTSQFLSAIKLSRYPSRSLDLLATLRDETIVFSSQPTSQARDQIPKKNHRSVWSSLESVTINGVLLNISENILDALNRLIKEQISGLS